MKSQPKTLLILVAAIGVGFVAGATVTGMLFRERLDYVSSFASPEGLVIRFKELTGPLSEDQTRQITPLIEAAGNDIGALSTSSRKEFEAIIEGLIADISVYLTEEQRMELNERRLKARTRYIGRYTVITDEAPEYAQ